MLNLRDAVVRHPLARKLPIGFDPEPLRADLANIAEDWWRAHLGPYHDGSWESVSLWAPGGDVHSQMSHGAPLAQTPAGAACPHVLAVLDAFPDSTRSRVRIMRLRSGGRIFRHSDPLYQIDPNLTRLHIPIDTSPQVEFLVNDVAVVMLPGEVWHVDVRFPHQVRNDGDSHRVHLVVDLVGGDHLRRLLRSATSVGDARLTAYTLKHSLPGRVRSWLGIGN